MDKPKNNQMLDIAQKAMEMAIKAGANDSLASTSKSRKVEISVRDGQVETVKEAVSKSISIRIWVDGKYGSHRSNDLRETELQKFITDAIALTRAVQPDPHRKMIDPALFANRSNVDLELYDAKVTELQRKDRLDICMKLNDTLKGSPQMISATSNVRDYSYESAMVSSNGFQGSEAGTSMWFGANVTLKDKGDKKPASGMWAGARHRENTPDPLWVAELAYERTKNMLGAIKGPTQKSMMIIDPSAASSLIWRLLSSANGRSISQGRSFWQKHLGKKAVSDKLTIVDNPLLQRGFSSQHYDGEGISTKQMNIIEQGVLNNLYIDTYYGSKLSMKPTTANMSNLIVTPGNRDLQGIIADCPNGIYVTNWLGGNSDGTTGDYSFGVRGNIIKDGKLGAPVSEMNVTGNFLDLFSNLIEVGNDPWQYSSILAPTLVFDGVDFS